MSELASPRSSELRFELQTLEAGLAIIVLVFLPGVPRAFEVPKEAAVYMSAAFVLVLLAATPNRPVPSWPRLWYVVLGVPLLAMTTAAAVEGTRLLDSHGVLRAWCYAAFGLALRLSLFDRGDVERLLRFVAGLGVAEAVIVVLQVPFGDAFIEVSELPSLKWLAFGTIGNPNWVGGFLAAVLPTVWLQTLAATGAARWVWSSGCVLVIAALVLTFSRGAWVGACAGITFLTIASVDARRWRGLVLAAMGVCLAAVIASATAPPKEIESAIARTSSVVGRLRMWAVTGDMIADRPWLGFGPGSFMARYPEYQRDYLGRVEVWPPVTQLTDQPHNEHLRLLAEAGPLAALGLLAAAGLAIGTGRGAGFAGTGAASGLVALLVFATVDNPLQVPVTTSVFVVLLVACLALRRTRESASRMRRLRRSQRIGVVVVAALLLVQGVRILMVERHHAFARAALATGSWEAAQAFAEAGLALENRHPELSSIRARSLAKLDRPEALDGAMAQARAVGLDASLEQLYASVEMRRGRSQPAVEALTVVRDTLPGLIQPRLTLAEIRLSLGDVKGARGELEAIVEIPVSDHRTMAALREQAASLLKSLPNEE